MISDDDPLYYPYAVKVPENTKEKYIIAGWRTSQNITEYQLSSVTTTKKSENIAFYPNPAIDYVVVPGAQGLRLTITDMQGHIYTERKRLEIWKRSILPIGQMVFILLQYNRTITKLLKKSSRNNSVPRSVKTFFLIPQ